MQTNSRLQNLQAALVLFIFLLLWNPLPALSFSQMGGGAGGTAEGGKAGNIPMQAVSGTVVETMNSGGYTYALVEKDGARTWVALPKSTIAVGNEITCRPGMVMNNFRSSSLNRTFDHIVFSSGIMSSAGNAAQPADNPAQDEAPPMPKTKEPKNWKDF